MKYREALKSAILYIENHLEDNCTVNDVAVATGYSYYHLTRLFQALLGEGLGSYVKKRRLASAAQKLLYTKERVLDIAFACGFSSGEAFSRAFKNVYAVSPWDYRKNQIDTFMGFKNRMDLSHLEHILDNITVHPKIVEIPDFLIVGLRGETTLRDNQIVLLWQEFNGIASKIPDVKINARAFGVCESCSNGNQLHSMSEDMIFTEVVGIEVTSLEGVCKPFVGKKVKGGRFALFTHKGSIAKLNQTFEYIWGSWLLSTKEEIDERDDFELYDERFLGRHHPESELDIYIPIK